MIGVENFEVQPLQARPLLLDNDLFDAEDSDSDVDYAARSPTPPPDNGIASPHSDENASPPTDRGASPPGEEDPHQRLDEETSHDHLEGTIDDGEDEPDIHRPKSPGNKSKQAKSSIAQSRTRRIQKADIKKIHSESQRIVRESDVNLPYHKPKPLSLNDFFSRKPSSTGALSVKSLKGLSKRQQISCLTQLQSSSASSNLNGEATLSQPLPSPKTSKLPGHHSSLSQSTNSDITVPQIVPQNTTTDLTVPQIEDSSEGDGEVIAPQSEHSSNGIPAPKHMLEDCCSEVESRAQLAMEDLSDHSNTNDKRDALPIMDLNEEVDDKIKDEVDSDRDVTGTPTTEKSLPGTPTTSEIASQQEIENEESSLHEQDGKENEETKQSSAGVEEKDNQQLLQEGSSGMETPMEEVGITGPSSPTHDVTCTPSQTPISAQALSISQSHRQKLLEASLSKVKTLTPRLSGASDSFIDLDNDDGDDDARFATPNNPGLDRLMKRFVKHTAKSTPRPRKEVKLSVVSKETGGDGKEDLKLDTVSVTIEGEDVEDPSLKIPGAKLVKLKEALQVKMRARREVERQRRKEAYRLDNEDYAQDEEDEMTDQSDTDESDDGLGDAGEEKKIKKSRFINHEATVEDDDDDEYEPGEDSEYDDNEDDTDDESDKNEISDDEDEDEDEEVEQEGPTKTQIYSADTDEENDEEEENIKRMTTNKAKKKKLVLDDEDEEDGDEAKKKNHVTEQDETLDSPVMELHLDADDEDENEEKMNPDDPPAEIPSSDRMPSCPKPKSPFSRHSEPGVTLPVDRPFLESASSLEGTTDSSDVDRLGESLIRRARSPKKGLVLEEKTRDLFESASNTDGGTTGSSEMDRTAEILAGRSGFSWSAVRKNHGAAAEDSSCELPKQLDNSSNSLDTSFEMMGSVFPAHQPGGGTRRSGRKVSLEEATDAFTPFAKHQSLLQSMPKTSSKLSELTLPVEDSQDLFRADTPSLTVAMDTQQGADTQSFRFSYDDEETQTQFLDENGFLKLRSASKPKAATKKLFTDENTSQDQLDELLGLCSGKFASGTENSSKIRKGLFSQLDTQRAEGTQGNMDELLGLCSGTFAQQKYESQAKTSLPVHDDTDNRSESSFHILSDHEADQGSHNRKDDSALSDDEDSKPKKKRKRIRMMDDEDSDDEANEEAENEEEEDGEEVFDSEDELSFMVKHEAQQGKTYPGKLQKDKVQKKVTRDFFEEEAELSGSEFGSDEDYDADDLPDELEQDETDKENVGTEDQLREQVNKVHMKTMDDDDARRLRLYKEMYLPDGDLYSDGKGRTRQFRWRHLDDDSQMNLFANNSDDEEEDEQDEDMQWRMERFKREQWLNEQKEKQMVKDIVDDDIEEESSQFDVFMKTSVNKKKKEPVHVNVNSDEATQKKDTEKRISTPKPIKFRHGSFLRRSKGDLAKIASMMKPLTSLPSSSRGSRNVLFQSISPPADEEEKKPQLRRSASDSPAPKAPPAKRPKLDRSQSLVKKSNSIFSLM